MRGRQHGRAFGDLIAQYPQLLVDQINNRPDVLHGQVSVEGSPPAPVTRALLAQRARAMFPELEKHFPTLVEEMRGIAVGARLALDDVLIVNLRGELVRDSAVGEPACTAVAASRGSTAGGKTFVGQNLDMERAMKDLLVVVHVTPHSGKQSIMLTFAGLIGYNGLGNDIAVAATAGSVGNWSRGLPHYPLKRLLLEQTSVSDAAAVMKAYRFSSAGNYVLGDGAGNVLGLEVAPSLGMATVEPDNHVLAHTNHFLSPGLAARDALLRQFPDSPRRHERAMHLLSGNHGEITLQTFFDLFRDHSGSTASICRHDDLESVGSFVACVEDGVLYATTGSPCLSDYQRFELA